MKDELNGRMVACEIFVTGVNIAGMDNTHTGSEKSRRRKSTNCFRWWSRRARI